MKQNSWIYCLAVLVFCLSGCAEPSKEPAAQTCIMEGNRQMARADGLAGRLEYEFAYEERKENQEARQWKTMAVLQADTSRTSGCAHVAGDVSVTAGALEFSQTEEHYYVTEGENALDYCREKDSWSCGPVLTGATRLVHQESFLGYLEDNDLEFTVERAEEDNGVLWKVGTRLEGERVSHMLYSAGCLLESCTGQTFDFKAAGADCFFYFRDGDYVPVKAEFLFDGSVQPQITGADRPAVCRMTLWFDSYADDAIQVPEHVVQEAAGDDGLPVSAKTAPEEPAPLRATYYLSGESGRIRAGVNTPQGLQMSYQSNVFMEFDNDLYGKVSYWIVEDVTEEMLTARLTEPKEHDTDYEMTGVSDPVRVSVNGREAYYLRMDYRFVETRVHEYCIWMRLEQSDGPKGDYLVCRILDLSVGGEAFAYEETEIVQKAIAAVRIPE